MFGGKSGCDGEKGGNGCSYGTFETGGMFEVVRSRNSLGSDLSENLLKSSSSKNSFLSLNYPHKYLKYCYFVSYIASMVNLSKNS